MAPTPCRRPPLPPHSLPPSPSSKSTARLFFLANSLLQSLPHCPPTPLRSRAPSRFRLLLHQGCIKARFSRLLSAAGRLLTSERAFRHIFRTLSATSDLRLRLGLSYLPTTLPPYVETPAPHSLSLFRPQPLPLRLSWVMSSSPLYIFNHPTSHLRTSTPFTTITTKKTFSRIVSFRFPHSRIFCAIQTLRAFIVFPPKL